MTRVTMALVAICMWAFASTALYAGHTAPELHLFFGNPVINGGEATATAGYSLASDPDLSGPAAVQLGMTVSLPIFGRVLDTPENPLTFVSGIAWDVFQVGTSMSYVSSGLTDPFGPATGIPGVIPPAGSGEAGTLQPDPLGESPGRDLAIHHQVSRSSISLEASHGVFFVGHLTILASQLGTDSLYLTNSHDNYLNTTISGSTVGQKTIAFGMDPTDAEADGDNMNSFLYSNTTKDVRAVFRGQTSTLADARIEVIPTCACLADVNSDTLIDGEDAQEFMDCLLATGSNCACADVDGVAGVGIGDVTAFVNELLTGASCP
ncbi:MAG: hypothetical protein V3T70_08880 [Phycisphaerae bacterium]